VFRVQSECGNEGNARAVLAKVEETGEKPTSLVLKKDAQSFAGSVGWGA
jgi:hypothetical protein